MPQSGQRRSTSLIDEEAQQEKLIVAAVSLVPCLSVIFRPFGLGTTFYDDFTVLRRLGSKIHANMKSLLNLAGMIRRNVLS
jgi:hypothetical protein